MDRLKREGNPPVGQLASPVPQYKDTVLNDWAEVKGEGGASYVHDKDAIAKLEQVRALLAGTATEVKLEEARTLLDSISKEDFATEETLAAMKTKIDSLHDKLNSVIDAVDGVFKTKVYGNITELYGKDLSARPSASSVAIGTTFMVIGTDIVYQSDGTDWVVISE